jgi:hypothetical protein
MNWYKIAQHVINVLDSTSRSYQDHYTDIAYKSENPNFYIWAYYPNEKLQVVQFDPEKHIGAYNDSSVKGKQTFRHDTLSMFPPNWIAAGRCDMDQKICTIGALDIIHDTMPDELIWKLMEKFGDDIVIKNFTSRKWQSPIGV